MKDFILTVWLQNDRRLIVGFGVEKVARNGLTHLVLVSKTLNMEIGSVVFSYVDFVESSLLLVDNQDVPMIAGVLGWLGTLVI